MWDVVWPMMFVLGGAIGLAGLVRILVVLSERDRQRSTVTTIMVLVGLLALASFNLYDGVDPENLAALLVYVLLPGIGSLTFALFGSCGVATESRVRSLVVGAYKQANAAHRDR